MTLTQDQIHWWRSEGDRHFSRAELMRREGDYAGCVLFCQQAAEFFFKLLYTHKRAESPPKSHDLVKLAEAVGCPEDMFEPLRTLTEDYGKARYPGETWTPTSDLYDAEAADERLRIVTAIRTWVLGQLGER